MFITSFIKSNTSLGRHAFSSYKVDDGAGHKHKNDLSVIGSMVEVKTPLNSMHPI